VALQLGRTFVSPAFDALVIGGGLSLLVALWIAIDGTSAGAVMKGSIPWFLLFVNNAHFAASTVRLYRKPDSFRDLPFLTMGFPLVTLLVLTAAIALADDVGRHFQALMLTWSPYHYCAQTYGLAAMYCYRSGCNLADRERKLLRATCLVPFGVAALSGTRAGSGLGWIVPWYAIAESDVGLALFRSASIVLGVLAFAMPVILFLRVRARVGRATITGSPAGEEAARGMPLISLMIIASNAVWFVVFQYFDAFAWAATFHGLQYLAIVSIFHVRDRQRVEAHRHGWIHHTVLFYAACVGLGYLLWQCWPFVYVMAGFGRVESLLMVATAINLHHFITDGYIWRLRADPNRRVVMAADPRTAA
jgi:hypothetical protein